MIRDDGSFDYPLGRGAGLDGLARAIDYVRNFDGA